MWKQTASLALCIAVMATTGCENDNGVLDPTPLGTSVTTSVNISPSIVTTESIRQPLCPTVPPFVGSLSLNVQTGDTTLSLSEVRMTFTDTLGAAAPSVTLPAPVLTRQFGSTLIAARSERSFPLTFPFGCGTRRTGTLVILVVAADQNGRGSTAEARVAVR